MFIRVATYGALSASGSDLSEQNRTPRGKKNNNIQAPLNSQHEPPVICYETRTLLGLFGRTEGVLQNEPKDNLLLFAAD